MRKKSVIWKRGLAMTMAAAMAFSGLPANVRAATGKVETQIKFDFNQEPENGVFSFQDTKATIQGGYSLQERDEANGKALYLDGTGYLKVTNVSGGSPLTGLKEVTISFDTKQDRTQTNWAFYAAPDEKAPANGKEHYLGALINTGTITAERYANTNGRPKNPSVKIGNDWAHIDIVVSEKSTALYVDGIKRSAENSTYQLEDILGQTGGIFQIGKANWGKGEFYKGWIDNFEIQGKALAEGDITTEELRRAAIKADADAIKLPETVKADFDLPAKGANGSTITWSVAENQYLKIEDHTAKVTRSKTEEGKAELTATVTFPVEVSPDSSTSIQEIRKFTVKIEQLLDEAESAKKQLSIPNMDNIRGNITLPTEIELEDYEGVTAAVTWKSADTTVITDKEENGKPAGVVTRQNQDKTVKLTATIIANGKTATKELDVTVKAAHTMAKTTDYLFAFFENNGGPAQQQIFLASSRDGNNWMDLNAKKAVLSVADSVRSEEDLQKNQNQAGVRDPYLIRSPEGDRFWLIATDLCIGPDNIAAGTVGWGISQYNGSHCLRIWESDDLVNWSEPWLADVAPADTTCAWAPEAVYDETTGEYIVFFASMTNMGKDDAGKDKNVQKVYYAKTRDFKTFTEPVKMVDNGDDHIIDTTILKAEDGTYYRGSAADGSIRLEKCKDGNWKGLNSWEKQGSIRDIAGFAGNLEGPELFKYNEDDYKVVDGEKKVTYGLLADNYGSKGYVPFYTTDIANADWKQTADNDYNFDTVHKRHGGILTLTAEEYNRVMEAYGPKTITVKTAPETVEYDVVEKTFRPSAFVLEVTYANGQKEEIAYPASGKNNRHFTFTAKTEQVAAGQQELTVTYGEKSASFQTTVELDQSGLPQEENVLADFNFDDEENGFSSTNAKAAGSHALKESYAEKMGKALYLDGNSANFLSITDKEGKSLLAGTQELTISYDMKPDATSTNWVVYAAPDDKAPTYNSEKYLGIMEKNGTTTVERYYNSGQRPTNPSAATGSKWYHVDVVLSKTNTIIYVNGQKIKEQESSYNLRDILGKTGVFYIGKANWGEKGEYFKGYLDNFKVINQALEETRVQELSKDFLQEQSLLAGATVGTAPDRTTALTYRGTDDHTAIQTVIDEEKKTITSYVKRGTDLTKVPVTLTFNGAAETITVDGSSFTNGNTMDLSKDRTLVIKSDTKELTFTIKKPILCNNPVLPGQYADPDIDYFDGKFWIYPTTDGYPGWSGTKFHAFSSPDMVNWTDEGVIMELANDNPGVNDKGVQIANSPWAVKGSAWAPTIEKKGDKYYFYYCGKKSDGASAIGVAVADHPAGPYTDKGEALVTTDMCKAAGVEMGQAIDPSIFTEDDGTSYILFGNGKAAIAQLNNDMTSIKEGTLKQITGLTDFRESVIVTKVDGKYHWTWSCDDANSPNYHVNYGVSDKLIQDDGTVKVTLKKKNLLSKDESKGILGSAHQSVVHVKDANQKDRYFMAYHRFYTPLNIFTSGDGLGVHRETCVDEIKFDNNGEMVITPTLEGVSAVIMPKEDGSVDLTPDVTNQGNGVFELTVPEFTPGQDVSVAIPLPGSLVDSIKDSQETEVSVNVKLPEGLADDKVQAITIPKEVLRAVKEAGKDLTVAVTGSTSYQWTFSAKDLADANLSDLNLALEVDSEKDAEIKNLLGKDETGMVLSFAQQGDLPGAKVTVDVTKMGWKAGETVTLSYYNPQTKKLETVGTYKVDKDGKIAIAPAKGGKYVLWQKTSSEPEPVIPVEKITLNKIKLTLNVNKTYQLIATVTPKNATNHKVTWNSENKSVATVSANGLVKAKKAGKVKITAKAGGKSITCTVTVKVPVSKVTLNKKKLTMGVKETFTLKATVKPKNATSKKVSWKTKNKKIVTVKNGKLTAKKKGNTTITATVGGKKVTCKVTVKPAPTKKAKVTLNKKKVSLKVKKTFQIKPKVSSKFGSATFKYSIDKKGKKVVKVDKNGKVTAKKKGKATITVKTYNGKAKATIKITVR